MNRSFLKSFVVLARTASFLTLLAFAVPEGRAQTTPATPTPTPKSEEVLRLEEEKAEKLDDTVAKLRAKNEQFVKSVEALVKADNVSGLKSLASYIKAENMPAALKGAAGQETNFYWLQLKALKAGGNNRLKTNLVVDIFTGGSRLSHSGGAVVEYILFDRNGQSVASAIFTPYSGYVKADKVKRLKNLSAVGDKLDK